MHSRIHGVVFVVKITNYVIDLKTFLLTYQISAQFAGSRTLTGG
jgi:hypothetical protein